MALGSPFWCQLNVTPYIIERQDYQIFKVAHNTVVKANAMKSRRHLFTPIESMQKWDAHLSHFSSLSKGGADKDVRGRMQDKM